MNKISIMNNKKILLIICLLIFPKLVSAVEIHQIYYDPVNSESGGEAVEFFNPHPFDVDIGGWIIATESSMQDAIIPANTTIKSNDYYLLADNRWDERKDDSNWRNADFMTPITLNNVDSGVALFNSSNQLIDAVGWGAVEGINNNLFSGTPTNDASQGFALLRINNTGDNSNDFIITEPDFYGNNIVQTEINITNSVQSNAYLLEGGSIIPNAGSNTTIHVRAGKSMSATFLDITKTLTKIDNSTYETRFFIPYYQAPGNYSIYFSDNTELQFEIKEIVSYKVIADKIKFNVIPGTSSISSNKIKILNKGNVNLLFNLETESMFNFQYKLEDDFLTFEDSFELGAGKQQELSLKVEIPENTDLGSYEDLIVLRAE
ncbi:hypothetical protein GF358_04535 [Candidatus Woesearchaeota archaeon]|nr:hypothetical protein [Candidatus Woesearchaeota archaeon]